MQAPNVTSVLVLITALVCAAVSACSRYPIDACRCSEIVRMNSREIVLTNKDTGAVLLGPYVELVKRLESGDLLVSNSMNERYASKYEKYQEGYFLHKCDGPVLVNFGTDLENALSRASDMEFGNQ